MEANDEVPILPPLTHPYLVEWWMAIGPTTATGMGEAPVSWQEISAWLGLTGNELEVWEIAAIRAMSQAFASQRNEARKPSCPAPYSEAEQEAANTDARVAAQFKAMLLAFKK